MKIKNLSLLLCIFIIVTFLSCDKNDTLIGTEPDTSEAQTFDMDKKVILGKKLENPYSVKNMKKAFNNLYNGISGFDKKYDGNTLKDTSEIQATDLYVRFWVEDDEQRNLLLTDSLNLSNIPLDVEVIQEGDYHQEQDTVVIEAKWMYASVSKDYNFNASVKHERLEDLFLPEPAQILGEEQDMDSLVNIVGKSNISKKFLFDLEDEALRITGNYVEPNEGTQMRRRKKRPQGYVKVKNTVSGRMDPVVGVKVKTRRWFKWAKGWTNSKGYYSVNRRYRRNVRYTVVFKNTKGFKIWRTIASVSSARYRAGRQSNAGHNINFNTNSAAWRWATVNNAAIKYLDYCTKFGIGKPHSNLRIAAMGNIGASSAPMLRRVWGIYGFTSKSKVKTFLAKANGINLNLNVLAHMLKFIQPDLIINANAGKGTDGVFSVTFHELAHASHFKKVGSRYWIKYINYILTYGTFNGQKRPYGDGHGKNAGVCALGEAWANHFGYTLVFEEFGNNNRIISTYGFDNFNPVNRPSNNSISKFKNPRISKWEGWIPAGIMLDITDNKKDLIRSGYYDNVSGYSVRDLYDALDTGIESPQRFRNRLLLENNNKDANDMRNLFEAYYWK